MTGALATKSYSPGQLREIAEGVAHLHGCDVVHGDLKAANVLISDDYHAQITDFGLSKYMSTSSTSLGLLGAGTVRWQSPELFENHPKSFASDTYAFGMVIFEVCLGPERPNTDSELTFVFRSSTESRHLPTSRPRLRYS